MVEILTLRGREFFARNHYERISLVIGITYTGVSHIKFYFFNIHKDAMLIRPECFFKFSKNSTLERIKKDETNSFRIK
jgi:hypothetical protein